MGNGPSSFTVRSAESVLSVIAHETGHGINLTHGTHMDRRQYDAVMRARK